MPNYGDTNGGPAPDELRLLRAVAFAAEAYVDSHPEDTDEIGHRFTILVQRLRRLREFDHPALREATQ